MLSWTLSVWLSRCRTTTRYLVSFPFVYRNWWAVLQSKLGKDVVLDVRDGTRYLVRAGTTDLAAVNESILLNPYLRSPDITLGDDATVIDIGANIGDFTMQVARRCPRGRIVAVEPVEANVAMIAAQVAINNVSNVQTIRMAVGAAEQRVAMSGSGMASRVAVSGGGEGVPMTTLASLLDDLGIETVDLLKLDCEGAEWDILPAADHVLPRVRQIAMEFHCERGWTAPKLAEWLERRGFSVTHTGGAWNGLLWATRRP